MFLTFIFILGVLLIILGFGGIAWGKTPHVGFLNVAFGGFITTFILFVTKGV